MTDSIPRTNDSVHSNRGWRCLSAVGLLVIFAVFFVMAGLGENGSLGERMTLVFVAYLLIQSVMIVRLTGTLYRQHELRQVQFSIEALLLITTILALPMGITRLAMPTTSSSDWGQALAMLMVSLLSLVPLLIVCEAIMFWRASLRKRRRSR